jgi:hypothetical protein
VGSEFELCGRRSGVTGCRWSVSRTTAKETKDAAVAKAGAKSVSLSDYDYELTVRHRRRAGASHVDDEVAPEVKEVVKVAKAKTPSAPGLVEEEFEGVAPAATEKADVKTQEEGALSVNEQQLLAPVAKAKAAEASELEADVKVEKGLKTAIIEGDVVGGTCVNRRSDLLVRAATGNGAAQQFDYNVVIIGTGVGGHGAALHAVEVGVLKPQVDVTSINDFINDDSINDGARGASNPFATFFHSMNPVPEAPASVDAQEVTPTAEQVSAVQEAPTVEEVVSVEGTAAAAPIVQVIVHALAMYARSEKDAGVGQKTWKSLWKVTLEISGFISLCHHKDAPVVNGLFKAASVNIGLDIWLVESWDLSEAVKKTTGDENKDVKLKVSEEGAPPGGDAEDAPVVSIGSIEDLAAGEPVSGSPQEKAKDSEHVGGVTEAPSEVVDVSPETPAEGSVENDVPVEATKSAEPDEGSGSLEAVPFDDVEAESGMS